MFEETFEKNLIGLLPEKREEAWSYFLKQGLPTKKDSCFRPVRLHDLYRVPFKSSAVSTLSLEKTPHRLVFINGMYRPEFSSPPDGVYALTLSQARLDYKSYLEKQSQRYFEEEKDPFSLLNRALHAEGLFLYLPPKSTCDTTIHIYHQVEGTEMLCSPRIHVFAGKGAHAQIYASQSLSGNGLWINSHLDFVLDEGATIDFLAVSEELASCWHFEAIRATLKKESQFHSYSVTNGGATSRQDYRLSLHGENCNTSLNGLWKLKESRQHHVNVVIDHQEPSSISLQKFKGILCDRSRSSFEGKIVVRPKAQKTNAYQMNHNLLVGKQAVAHTKPNLEIFADDVKASHGATVGRIDEDALFYFKTRGIPEKHAQEILMRGFGDEIVLSLPNELARKLASQLVSV